jgi:outer membrane lipoprotein-sorting protein
MNLKVMKKENVRIVKIVTGALLFLEVQALEAQSFKDLLTGMQKEYASIETVHIQMAIQVYEDEKSKSPYFKEVADIKRQSGNYCYQFGTTYMLMNAMCLVMVDKGSKEIVYTKRSPAEEEKLYSDPFKVNLDSILLLYENPGYIGSEGDGEHYRIFQKKGAIKQIDIFVDTTENRMKRIEYRYEDGHYVVIQFTTFDKHPVFEADTFSESRYVIEEKGKLKAARAFIGFHVATVDGR